MKLLEINVGSGVKSTGRIATDIANEFVKMGHEAAVAYGRKSVDRGIQTYRISTQNQCRIDALLCRIFDNAGFNNSASTSRFIKWLREYDPDIIHLHNLHGYYVNIEVLFQYLRVCGKRIIWTLHDCWTFTGHCTHFEYAGCYKWKELCHNCPQKRAYPKSLFLDRSKKNYMQKKSLFTNIPDLTIVTPSYWLSELVKESFLKEYPVKVINNGIDLSVFKPTESSLREKYGLGNKKILLGVASPWDKRKGLQDFVRLSSMLDEKYKIVLIGLDDKQKKNLPDTILGFTRTDSVDELAQWYTTADVFVNPTYEDNYPTVNLEAQACGTPVITYKTGGSGESVPPENVVKVGDFNKIFDMIVHDHYKKELGTVQSKEEFSRLYLELFFKQ